MQNYQKDLEESMKESKLGFDSVDLLYYRFQKVSLKRGRWHVNSLKWKQQ